MVGVPDFALCFSTYIKILWPNFNRLNHLIVMGAIKTPTQKQTQKPNQPKEVKEPEVVENTIIEPTEEIETTNSNSDNDNIEY